MNICTLQALDAPVIGYLHENHDRLVLHKSRPAVIVCPGGGYDHLSPREREPVALHFAAMGYQAFTLDYSVGEKAAGLRPLRQLAETVRMLRARAREWDIDPSRIAVMGFSSGGHLAGSLSALWHRRELGLDKASRPDAAVLCYPVVTSGAYAHKGSFRYLAGGDENLRELLSLEKQITSRMPPTFVWHCVGDEGVSVMNSLLLVEALQRAGVEYECHLFQGGKHGLSLCNRETNSPAPDIAAWLPLCDTWLNRRFGFEP